VRILAWAFPWTQSRSLINLCGVWGAVSPAPFGFASSLGRETLLCPSDTLREQDWTHHNLWFGVGIHGLPREKDSNGRRFKSGNPQGRAASSMCCLFPISLEVL